MNALGSNDQRREKLFSDLRNASSRTEAEAALAAIAEDSAERTLLEVSGLAFSDRDSAMVGAGKRCDDALADLMERLNREDLRDVVPDIERLVSGAFYRHGVRIGAAASSAITGRVAQ